MEHQNSVSEISMIISTVKEFLVIQTKGSLIYQTMQSAKDQLFSMDQDKKGYIMDMRGLSKIDSTGFGLILNVIKRIPRDKKLVIILTDPFIHELFRVTKVDALVEIFDTMEEAEKSFDKGGI